MNNKQFDKIEAQVKAIALDTDQVICVHCNYFGVPCEQLEMMGRKLEKSFSSKDFKVSILFLPTDVRIEPLRLEIDPKTGKKSFFLEPRK